MPKPSPSVFISYRSGDDDHARLLWRECCLAFGEAEVYLDKERLEGGDAFPENLREAIQAAEVLLAVIGPAWRTSASLERLCQPDNYLRMELELGLSRREHEGLLLMPVMMGDAGMPEAAVLPTSLATLTTVHAEKLGNTPDYSQRVAAIMKKIDAHCDGVLAKKCREWFLAGVMDEKCSRARFHQNLAFRAPGIWHQPRAAAHAALDAWWENWPNNPRPFVLLGEEGDGKSWALADWLATQAESHSDQTAMVYAAASRAQAPRLSHLLEQALAGPVPSFALESWAKSHAAWSADSTRPAFLLVVDAFNERSGLDWATLFDDYGNENWHDQVAIIALCRPVYWQRHLAGRVGDKACTWTLGCFDDRELNTALKARRAHRDNFRADALALMAKPRYFDLALRLHDRVEEGGVTKERLIYESWREMYERRSSHSRPLGHEEFMDLIREMAASRMESLATRHFPELLPPGPWKEPGKTGDLLEELRSARIVEEKNGKLSVSGDYLALGLGLVLAVMLEENEAQDMDSLDQIIAENIQGQAEIDIQSHTLGMALCHAMRQADYPDQPRLALLKAWAESRNIDEDDLAVVSAYLPLHPETYLQMAAHLWGETDNRDVQDAFMVGFIRYGNEAKVQAALVPAFTEWLGLVLADGYIGYYQREPEKLLEGRRELEERLGTKAEAGTVVELFGFRLTVVTNHGLMRLAQVAVAAISNLGRRAYVQAIATGFLARSVMSGSMTELDWLCRTSDSHTQVALMLEAEAMLSIGHVVADKAAKGLLHALGTGASWAKRDGVNVPPAQGQTFLLNLREQETCSAMFGSWTQANYLDCLERDAPQAVLASQLKNLLLEPGLFIPEHVRAKWRTAGEGLDLGQVALNLGATREEHILKELEPFLCAFVPERYAELMSALAGEMSSRSGQARQLLAWELFEHMPVLDTEARRVLDAAWEAVIEPESDEDRWAEMQLFAEAVFDRPAHEQFSLAMRRHQTAFLGRCKPRFRPLDERGIPTLVASLNLEETHGGDGGRVPLWYLSTAMNEPSSELRPLLLRLYRQGDSVTRGLCMDIFHRSRDREAIEEVIRSGWMRIGGKENWYEDQQGSRLLCEYGSDLGYADLAARIDPTWLGYALACRGYQADELADYAALLDQTWLRIADMNHELGCSEYRHEIKVDRSQGSFPVDELDVSEAHSGTLYLIRSTWGGRAGETPQDQIDRSLDLDARAEATMAAYRRFIEHEEAMRLAGNPWFGTSFHDGQLHAVVAMAEVPWRHWVNVVLEGGLNARRLLAYCRGFYEKLCTSLLDHEPETGAKLFHAMRDNPSLRIIDAHAGLPILLLDLFAAKDSLAVEKLRYEELDDATSDHALFEVALMCGLGKSQGWLDEISGRLLSDSWIFHQAKALALMGYSNREEDGEYLAQYIADHTESWPREVAQTALERRRRSQWARDWFQRFLAEEDRVRAWAAFRLFLHCVDRRYLLWFPEYDLDQVASWKKEALLANLGNVEKAAEKNEKEWHDTFLGQKIKQREIWPWMGEY